MLQVIFFIFIKILMLLLSKLKADQVKFTDYRYRYSPCHDTQIAFRCQKPWVRICSRFNILMLITPTQPCKLWPLDHKLGCVLRNITWVCFVLFSLARATLVLIPLLGIHEVVFTVLIDECVEGSSRYARNFINLTLSSFQVPSGKSKTH